MWVKGLPSYAAQYRFRAMLVNCRLADPPQVQPRCLNPPSLEVLTDAGAAGAPQRHVLNGKRRHEILNISGGLRRVHWAR